MYLYLLIAVFVVALFVTALSRRKGLFILSAFLLFTLSTLVYLDRTLNQDDIFKFVYGGNIKMVRWYLNTGTSVQVQDRHGDSLLMVATKCRQYRMMQFLLERGVRLDLKNKEQQTVLNIAAKNQDDIAITILKRAPHQ